MLEVLHLVESKLPGLLEDTEAWASKCIDYSPPITHRLYRDVILDRTTYRVYLHRIHPCERAFFHPHPWPSAIRVLPVVGSTYEMAVGFGPNDRHDPPPHAAVIRVAGPKTLSGDGGFEYSMEHPDGWHYVRVLGEPSVSVMVSGPPWERPGGAPRTATRDFRPLTEEESDVIFEHVHRCYTYRVGS